MGLDRRARTATAHVHSAARHGRNGARSHCGGSRRLPYQLDLLTRPAQECAVAAPRQVFVVQISASLSASLCASHRNDVTWPSASLRQSGTFSTVPECAHTENNSEAGDEGQAGRQAAKPSRTWARLGAPSGRRVTARRARAQAPPRGQWPDRSPPLISMPQPRLDVCRTDMSNSRRTARGDIWNARSIPSQSS